MKQIIFRRLLAKNFLSFGDEGVEITFHDGINIITGMNLDKDDKNGVGKSSVVDAIHFAVFGEPLRPIKIGAVSNWTSSKKQKCEVQLDFAVIDNGVVTAYNIVRNANPSKLEFKVNGVESNQTLPEMKLAIKKIISATPELFAQIVLMCVNQTEPFLAKTPVVKTKFIENIFRLDIFTLMLGEIRARYNKIQGSYEIEKSKIDEVQRTLDSYKKLQDEYATKKISRINALADRIVANTKKAEELTGQLEFVGADAIPEYDAEIALLTTKEKECGVTISNVQSDITTIKSNLFSMTEKVRELQNTDDDVCLRCKRPFTDEDKSEKARKIGLYTENINILKTGLGKFTTDLKELTDVLDKHRADKYAVTNKKNEIAVKIERNKGREKQIEQLKSQNTQIESDIKAIENETNEYSKLIEETTNRINALYDAAKKYKDDMSVLDTAKYVVSDEGVKSFIIKKMLNMLNTRINYYLRKLDAPCTCTFDEYFNEKILNNRLMETSYHSFSGGEKKRIDIAMLFTFLDIRRLQSNISTNILFYDELLDSSLSDKGVESVLNILKERIEKFGESVYIITHKNEAIKHVTGEIVFLEKKQDSTRRIEYGIQ